MKRFLAAIAVTCAAILPAACNQAGDSPAAAETPIAETDALSAGTATPEPVAVKTNAPPVIPAAAGTPAAPGAPAFASLYPGASLDAPAVTASSPAGPGGLATYTTEADPDAVIAFHRARAEAAGLSSAMAMNQGEARAYGAANPASGASLQVVASATGPDTTSVQLSWSAGR